MGATGGASPRPWSQFQQRTMFLRVPSVDWAGVKHGSKTEFRMAGASSITRHWNIETPTPVVAYVIRNGQYDSQLMVLTYVNREPVGAISPESIAAEGFPDFAHFRRYWMSRTHRRFAPLTTVMVYRLRHFNPDTDPSELGARMLARLYREHVPSFIAPTP